jgi:hypothetical protein
MWRTCAVPITTVLFIKDFIDDPDGSEEKAFRHFFADCMGKGVVIDWGDLM